MGEEIRLTLIIDQPPDEKPDEFTNAVHCLIYSMVEAGITGRENNWWGEDFLNVKRLLEAKGLNCDPSKEVEGDPEGSP